jgi:ferredoxin
MSVLINFKMCDNASECSGIAECPTGAFKWDEDRKTIYVDENECINCGKCENACPVGAIRVAKTKEEEEKIKKEIEEDPRHINDLFVDRYGAQPINTDWLCAEKDFEKSYNNTARPVVIELFEEKNAMCLLKSIPIKGILEAYDIESLYRKINIETEELLHKFEIKELPALLFFRDGKLIGKFEGYTDNEIELLKSIKEIENNENR